MPKTTARLRLLIAAGALALAGATPAQAALFKHVYTGTVTSGYDSADLFKTGTNLIGMAYTATYMIDDSKGYSSSFTNIFAGSSETYGGPSFGYPESPVSATLTINGTAIAVSGSLYSNIYQYDYKPGDSTDDIAASQVRGDDIYMFNTVSLSPDSLSDGDYRTAFSVTVKPGDYGYGNFAFGSNTNFQGNVASLTSSSVAAVPEPASWALMIGGFGIAGGALRRRPRQIAVMA